MFCDICKQHASKIRNNSGKAIACFVASKYNVHLYVFTYIF